MTPVLGCISVFFVLAAVVVLLRLYTRVVLIKRTGGEDYLVAASFLVSFAWFIAHVIAAYNGYGSPQRDLSPESLHRLRVAVWVSPAFWGLSSAFCKMSIVWQYRRVFPNRWMLVTCNALLGVLTLYGLFSFFGAIFFCIPIRAAWGEAQGSCMRREVFFYLCSAVNIFMDCVIYAIPVPLIRRLQIPKRQKYGLYFVFSFGAFVIVASIVRLVCLHTWLQTSDSTVAVENVGIWSGIEMNVSIVCACLAVLRPLLSRNFRNRTSSYFSRRSHRHSHRQVPDETPRGNHKLQAVQPSAHEGNDEVPRIADEEGGIQVEYRIAVEHSKASESQKDLIPSISRASSAAGTKSTHITF